MPHRNSRNPTDVYSAFRPNWVTIRIRGVCLSSTQLMKSLLQHRDDIVQFGRLLHQTGLVAATDGNLSVRLEDGTFLCTPTLMSKGMMTADDLVIVDSRGHKVSGARNVS